jgi:hypothetical protein
MARAYCWPRKISSVSFSRCDAVFQARQRHAEEDGHDGHGGPAARAIAKKPSSTVNCASYTSAPWFQEPAWYD